MPILPKYFYSLPAIVILIVIIMIYFWFSVITKSEVIVFRDSWTLSLCNAFSLKALHAWEGLFCFWTRLSAAWEFRSTVRLSEGYSDSPVWWIRWCQGQSFTSGRAELAKRLLEDQLSAAWCVVMPRPAGSQNTYHACYYSHYVPYRIYGA